MILNISNNFPFAALTVEQAGMFIKDIVHRELETIKSQKPDPPPESDILLIDGALEFLAEHGSPIAKGSLYNFVAKKSIPSRKINGRLVFSRSELIGWVEKRTECNTSRSDAALLLAEHACKRSK